MPAPATSDARRQPLLLTMLFWAGVALAPVAALILLVADGNGPLRFAAVLAILAVVLIGLSIALRPDGEGASARTDELLDEIEELRRELRGEIVAAAQRGNQALDQAQRAHEGIAAVRRRLDASGAALAGAAPAVEPAGAGRARVAAVEPPVDDTPVARNRGDAPAGRARVSGPDDAPRWGRPEHADDDEPAYAREAPEPPAAAGMYGGERPAATAYGSARPREHDRPEAAHRPGGVVRHTETVHVTTRHTVVDGGPAEPAGRYGGGYAGQWTAPAQEWTRGDADQPPRPSGRARSEPEQHPRAGYGDEPGWTGRRDEPEWTDRRDAYAQPDEPAPAARSHRTPERPPAESWDSPDDRGWSEQRDRTGAAAPQPGPPLQADDTGEYWSQLRAGDRWAAVRDDENGRELRVGERRAEVHADATGTEYRVADRWAAVRHEEPRRDEDAARYEEPRRHEDPRRHEEPRRHEDAGRYEEPRRHEAAGRYEEPRRHDGGRRAEPGRPALPVGGVPVPAEWRPPRQRGHQAEPAPERTGRRRVDERYGYPPQDDVPRAGGAPPTDRWR
ncbi:hypothetical protein PSH03_004174 [Micromonospora sp. PSH03]|uniref:hypothetical protein n=1 Tax=Micromonospora salmantinae TaxID=2911211 RepID=UPI001EE8F016|nr:hypothetical protein [Micromonospora salmantinae]MCG5458422.1 hypothetical protein [Micromonospora salmantinae]